MPEEKPGMKVALATPRLAMLLPSLYASAPTLSVMFASNMFRVENIGVVFAAVYLAALPVVIVGLHYMYRAARTASSLCGGRIELVPFIVGVLPLGYLVPQYYLLSALAQCPDAREKVKPGFFLLDLIVNTLTFGIVIIMYGFILERVLRALASEYAMEE